MSLVFGKPEQREAWEEAFTEAKQKLGEVLKFLNEFGAESFVVDTKII